MAETNLKAMWVAGVVLAASGAALNVALPAAWVDMQTMRARWQVDRWAAGLHKPPTLQEWGAVRQTLADGLRITPRDANLLEALAWLYASRAQAQQTALPGMAQDFFRQSLVYYQAAAQLRPMSAVAWANVALSAHYVKDSDPALLWQAFDKALAWGHREPSAQYALADVGFARWDQLTPQRQQALLSMVNHALPHSRPRLVSIATMHHRQTLLAPEAIPVPPRR